MTTTELKDKIKHSDKTIPEQYQNQKKFKTKKEQYNALAAAFYDGYSAALDTAWIEIEKFEKANALNIEERKSRVEFMRAAGQALDAISHAVVDFE